MNKKIKVETQGISDDWSTADGNFDTKSRGMLKHDQLLSAMLHLAPLDSPEGDDVCPPHVLTEGQAGSFSFIGQGGTIFCPETESEYTPHQAMALAFDASAVAPPPPKPPRSATAKKAGKAATIPVIRKKKFGWRGSIVMFFAFCFLLGAVVMAFGVVSMQNRGVSGSDIKAAMTIGGGLGIIGLMLLRLAFKSRQTFFVDGQGQRVAADGSTLPFVAMAQHFDNIYDDQDDYDGGDDFD